MRTGLPPHREPPSHRHPSQSRRTGGLLLIAIAFMLTGCSSFNSKWDALAAQPVEQTSTGILGRWEGQWISGVSDHKGRLRCVVETIAADNTKATGDSPATHLFLFSATWGPGIVSDYDIAMQVTPNADGSSSFEGEMKLGWFMGTYRCKGRIQGDKFEATYEADQDNGTFEMMRP